MRDVCPMRAACALAILVVCGCGEEESDPGQAPLFPVTYRDTYVEVRGCRTSTEHGLSLIRVLVDPSALAAYQERQSPFPAGAVVLKEEYPLDDDSCQGSPQGWTVMKKLAPGSSPGDLDWAWQRLDSRGAVTGRDSARCISCHQGCGLPPDGYDGTCTVP